MRIEADEVTDLDDGDAPLGHQPTHVAQARPQSERNLVHGEERRGRTPLATFGAAQGTLGGPRGTAGEGTAFGPALAVGRLSAPSLPLGAGAVVVTIGAHRNPLSARRRWTRSAKVIRRTISSLATASRSLPEGVVDVGAPRHHGEGDEIPDESGHEVAQDRGPLALPDEAQLGGPVGE